MKTYEIDRKEIEGLPVLAEGYKAIKYNSSTKGDSAFRYGEKGGNLVGKVFKVDGNISECHWGLHFSKDPAYVFNFYEPLTYNRYFKVRAYSKVIESEDGFKSVAQMIEFEQEFNFIEFIEVIKAFDRTDYGVNGSNGVNWSYGVNNSYGINKCSAVSNSVFCAGIEAEKHMLFNKKVEKARFEQVYNKILSFEFYPNYNNFYKLKGDKEWWSICFPELMNVDSKTAWSKMPAEMKEYLQSLPEYDEEVFKAVIG